MSLITKPKTIFFENDGEFVPWIVVQLSRMPGVGNGLFADRNFKEDQIITKYLGQQTSINNGKMVQIITKRLHMSIR